MEYDIEKKSNDVKSSQDALVGLYVQCKDIDEFYVRADVEMPEARARDIRACKLHWLSKAHPFLYYGFWTVLAMIAAMCVILCAASKNFSSNVAQKLQMFSAFYWIAWPEMLWLHDFLHTGMMQYVRMG